MTDFSERITILSANEIEDLYGLPEMSEEDRQFYFAINSEEQNVAYSHRSLTSKVFFILQLGYFKAKRMFFVFSNDEIRKDVQFIKDRYFARESILEIFEINKTTRWNQQQRILSLYDYQECDASWRVKLQEKASQCVRVSSKPTYIFKDLLSHLEKSRVVLPAYSTMQKIVSKAIIEETERLSALGRQHITSDIERALQELLSREDSPYMLTLLKKEPRDFRYKQISQEIAKQDLLKPLYDFARGFLPRLDISNDNIRYYASLVDYYSVFRIRQLRSKVASVYLLCFVYHRFQCVNDNLANAFIYHVRKYEAAAKLEAKSSVLELKVEGNRQLDQASKVLNLFVDDKIPDETTFGEIKKRAFGILEEDKFPVVTRYISRAGFDQAELEWRALVSNAQTIKKNIRPVFLSLEVQSTSNKDALMEAVDFLKTKISKKKSLAGIKPDLFPQAFIRRKLRRYIIKKKKIKIHDSPRKVMGIRSDRYEFLVYSLLRQYLESGDVYLRDSARFRSFEDDLIDDERWKDKEQLIRKLDLPILSNPIEGTLAELEEELEALFVDVNQRIEEGKNEGIKITGSGADISWSLPYKKPEDTTNNPLFEHLPQIEIRDLLAFIDSQCGVMSAFTHMLGRYIKGETEEDAIAGALIALATNKGLFKMAESSDMSYQALFSAMKNYLRLETLRNANDMISNALFNLSVFKHFNIVEGLIHSSSDGQKFETQINTINARYSPKYFGLKKGVTSYTLVANNVPVNAKIIGANDHESHFVFDILFNNTSEIQSDRHSVDTHGTNNVNFLILNAFGYEFAPRYKHINSRSETICGFKNLKHYEEFLLRPSRRPRQKLIITEWPNVQRILVSLGLKSTTQSVIVGKLSSYARKNRTKRAMWELDSIFRSIYILKYVDDMLLRQNVQRALNRGEAYHQLRRAIPHEYSGKFRVETEEEQNVWSECSRLIANAIIFYNAYLLTRLLEQMEEEKRIDLVEQVRKVSPIAWRHVNLSGRFDLTSQKETINIDLMLSRMGQSLAQSTS